MLKDHLGNVIDPGSTIFWAMSMGSKVEYLYGLVSEVRESSLQVLRFNDEQWFEVRLQNALPAFDKTILKRLDLATVIEPSQVPSIYTASQQDAMKAFAK